MANLEDFKMEDEEMNSAAGGLGGDLCGGAEPVPDGATGIMWRCPACQDTGTFMPAFPRRELDTHCCGKCGNWRGFEFMGWYYG